MECSNKFDSKVVDHFNTNGSDSRYLDGSNEIDSKDCSHEVDNKDIDCSEEVDCKNINSSGFYHKGIECSKGFDSRDVKYSSHLGSKLLDCSEEFDNKGEIKIEPCDLKYGLNLIDNSDERAVDAPGILLKKELPGRKRSVSTNGDYTKPTELTKTTGKDSCADSVIVIEKEDIKDENHDFDIEEYNEPFIVESDSEIEKEMLLNSKKISATSSKKVPNKITKARKQKRSKSKPVKKRISRGSEETEHDSSGDNFITNTDEENYIFSEELRIDLKDVLWDWRTRSKVVLKGLSVILNRSTPNLDIKRSQSRKKSRRSNTRIYKLNERGACRVCYFKSDDENILRQHEDLHLVNTSDVRKFKCLQCNYKARCSHHVKMHVARIHINRLHKTTKLVKCQKCDYKSHKYAMRVHTLTHASLDEVETYECDKCSFITKNKYVLTHHVEAHRAALVFKFKCEECDFKSNHENRFKIHTMEHVTGIEADMNETVIVGDKERFNYRCDLCGYRTRVYANFRRHRFTHVQRDATTRMYTCDKCEFKSGLKHPFVDHLKYAHPVPRVTYIYQCEHCSYRSDGSYELKRHLLTHKNTDEVEMHRCAHCNFETKFRKNVIIHYRNIHAPKLKKTYKCEICCFETTYKASYKSHVNVVHQNSAGLEVIPCPHCPYKTFRKGHLLKHIQVIHTTGEDVIWYKCTKCKFRSRHDSAFRNHMKNVHKKSWYACPNCSHTTHSSELHEAHKKKHKYIKI